MSHTILRSVLFLFFGDYTGWPKKSKPLSIIVIKSY